MNKSLLLTYSSRSLECLRLNESQPISGAFRFSLPQTQASNMRLTTDNQLQSSPAPSQLIKCTENSDEHTEHCPEIPSEPTWLHFPAQNPWIPGAALAGAFSQAGTLLYTLYWGAAGHRLAQTRKSCAWELMLKALLSAGLSFLDYGWQFFAQIRGSKCEPEQMDHFFNVSKHCLGSDMLWVTCLRERHPWECLFST